MNNQETAITTNRIALGILMLIPGLITLFSAGMTNMTTFLSALGFPAATLFAWLLIGSEIIFGTAILANYKLKYTTIPPAIILLTGALVMSLPASDWPSLLMHLTIFTNYLIFTAMDW